MMETSRLMDYSLQFLILLLIPSDFQGEYGEPSKYLLVVDLVLLVIF